MTPRIFALDSTVKVGLVKTFPAPLVLPLPAYGLHFKTLLRISFSLGSISRASSRMPADKI